MESKLKIPKITQMLIGSVHGINNSPSYHKFPLLFHRQYVLIGLNLYLSFS